MNPKCASCPVAPPLPCLAAELARTVCARVAAGDREWVRYLPAISRQGDPLDFDNNPAYRPPGKTPPPIPVPPDPAVVAAIGSCPDRGSSLPVSLQPECGCDELYECRAGVGEPPGSVTTRDCYACRSASPAS